MWYTSDIETYFNRFSDAIIKQLSQELSEISLRTPIFYKPEEYKKGTFKQIFIDINSQFFTASSDNHCDIAVSNHTIKEHISPLYLMGLFVWCVDRLSGSQVEDKEGFDYLKRGKMLSKGGAI